MLTAHLDIQAADATERHRKSDVRTRFDQLILNTLYLPA